MSWIIEENTDPTFQDWGEAYKELCELVRTKVPEIKHIDLYYGQDQVVDSTGNWIPFKAPALFMQFDVVQAQDLGDQTQQLLVDVTMYLAMETVQDTNDRSLGQRRALEFVAMMRRLHMELHGKAGDHFNALSRVGMSKKADAPPYMYMYGQTYRTVLLDNSTSKQWSWREPGTLGLEIEPHTAPPVPVGRLVVIRNSDDTYSVEVEAPDVHTLPDVTHTDSNGLPVTQPALTPFVATQCPSPLPATARLRQTGGAQIGGDHIIPSGGSLDIVAPNGIVSVQNSLSVELSQVYPMSGQSIVAPVPDSTFRIKDSANNDIGSAYSITAGGTGQGIVPDSVITRPDGTTANLRATQPLDVRNYRSGILYAFGEARWSGQVTSYRFGDEGTAYATLFFQMPVPLYPSQVAKLGNTWNTLGSLNKWGDNRRFTGQVTPPTPTASFTTTSRTSTGTAQSHSLPVTGTTGSTVPSPPRPEVLRDGSCRQCERCNPSSITRGERS